MGGPTSSLYRTQTRPHCGHDREQSFHRKPGADLLHPYANIKANAYDMVLNGNEIGGGSIRIFQRDLQEKMFDALGMTKEEAFYKFGFLLGAFEYGAPPHGGLAFGFDRLCSLLGGASKASAKNIVSQKTIRAGTSCWMPHPILMKNSLKNFPSSSTSNN